MAMPATPDLAGQGCGLATCASMQAGCGPIGDGCGGVLDCGSCPFPQTCGGGGTSFQCGGTAACVPKTCDGIPANCGMASDGCGNVINCWPDPANPSCPNPGDFCGGAGPNMCGNTATGTCTPRTCPNIGPKACGLASDNCGGTINCGDTCTAPEFCGGGGTPNVCGGNNGCIPKTCSGLGFNCGFAGDGCGGLLNCGSCTTGICGGGGANVCGGTAPDAGTGCSGTYCGNIARCDAGTTTLSGTVFAPTANNPDPIYNALVFVPPNGTVTAFPTTGVSCDKCNPAGSDEALVSATTGPDGKFTLTNVPCGVPVKMVIQLGRWRRVVTIPASKLVCCANNVLDPTSAADRDLTRLPRNKSEGDIPLLALTTGNADSIECVLRKIGISDSEFTLPSGNGRIRLYRDNGANMISGISTALPAATTLYGNVNELKKYDAVIVDCVGSQVNRSAAELSNMLEYTRVGGRLFASHYAYVWLYNNAPFSGTASWMPEQGNPPSPLRTFVDTSFPKGTAFAQWLFNAKASTVLGEIQASVTRRDVNSVVKASPYLAEQFLYWTPSAGTNVPLQYTFNTPINQPPVTPPPEQCGRVLFSDYHISGTSSSGTFPSYCSSTALTPQEKVLEFLLFDLTSCVAPLSPPPPTTCTPKTCTNVDPTNPNPCGPQGDGCGGMLNCADCPAGQTCGGGGANKCGGSCTPKTCTTVVPGNTNPCGPQNDGCGNIIMCATCPAGQTCGGGGQNKCGTGTCAPLDCTTVLPGNSNPCGSFGDGCGGTLTCATCPAGQTCGGTGTVGVCGTPVCTPRQCTDIGANCGTIGDGCGKTIDCGTCTAPETCGGDGRANICGARG